MKKKIAGLVLAATLVTGMGGFGTYSMFTDKDTFNQEINITTGTLDIATDYLNNEWEVKTTESDHEKGPNGNNKGTLNKSQIKSNSLVVSNVKPGDYFTKSVIIKNQGSLNANVAVEINKELEKKDNIETGLKFLISEVDGFEGFTADEQTAIETALKGNGKIENVKMRPGSYFTVKVKFELPIETERFSNDAGEIIKNQLVNNNDAELLTIDSKQYTE